MSNGARGPSRRNVVAWLAAEASLLRPLNLRATESRSAPKFRRGISLHNMLNWPEVQKSEAGLTYPRPPFGGKRYEMSRGELDRLRSVGFDFIRLTADPSIWLASSATERGELAVISSRVVE